MPWVYDGRGEKFQAEAAVDAKPEESLGREHAVGCMRWDVWYSEIGAYRGRAIEAGLSLSG